MDFNFFPQFLYSSNTVLCMYQSNTNQSVELPSDHSTPSHLFETCSLCQLKSHQKPQGNTMWRTLPMKDTQNGSSKAQWCVQSADTHSQCVWGGSWAGRAQQTERGRSSGAGRAAWERLHGGTRVPPGWPTQGWWEQSAGVSPGPTSEFWPFQLPFSQVLSTLQELSPSTREKF